MINIKKIYTKLELYKLVHDIWKKDHCDICGSKKYLTIHHKDNNKNNNKYKNIGTLCKLCHRTIHNILPRTKLDTKKYNYTRRI